MTDTPSNLPPEPAPPEAPLPEADIIPAGPRPDQWPPYFPGHGPPRPDQWPPYFPGRGPPLPGAMRTRFRGPKNRFSRCLSGGVQVLLLLLEKIAGEAKPDRSSGR